MTKSELKNIAIREILRGFESAMSGVERFAEKNNLTIEETGIITEFVYKFTQEFTKKHV